MTTTTKLTELSQKLSTYNPQESTIKKYVDFLVLFAMGVKENSMLDVKAVIKELKVSSHVKYLLHRPELNLITYHKTTAGNTYIKLNYSPNDPDIRHMALKLAASVTDYSTISKGGTLYVLNPKNNTKGGKGSVTKGKGKKETITIKPGKDTDEELISKSKKIMEKFGKEVDKIKSPKPTSIPSSEDVKEVSKQLDRPAITDIKVIPVDDKQHVGSPIISVMKNMMDRRLSQAINELKDAKPLVDIDTLTEKLTRILSKRFIDREFFIDNSGALNQKIEATNSALNRNREAFDKALNEFNIELEILKSLLDEAGIIAMYKRIEILEESQENFASPIKDIYHHIDSIERDLKGLNTISEEERDYFKEMSIFVSNSTEAILGLHGKQRNKVNKRSNWYYIFGVIPIWRVTKNE